jgi:hypothetical protein
MSHDSVTARKPTATRTRLMWGGRAISALLGLLLMMSAVMKLMGGTEVVEGFARMGLPASLRVPLGILELFCVVLYLIPVTSVTGAILLTGYIGGAIVTHLRLGEPVYMQIALGFIIWLGLYLREPRLTELIPVKSGGASHSGQNIG